MSWYRTYRPTTISGLHLTQVRDTFLQLMAQGKLPQTLLFTGPKGTGKTSTSRIIAAMVNEPANQQLVEQLFLKKQSAKSTTAARAAASESSVQAQWVEPQPAISDRVQSGASLMVHELDAASNRGIDDIRALKERINLPPQDGLMSVYILDEVHMLTSEAFNALLKVLEEPPAHVIFILATTELHKLPATIVSRCTVIRFAKATVAELTAVFEQILTTEHVTFEPAALAMIAQRADGSFRDGVKLLELVASEAGEVSLAACERLLSSSASQVIPELITAVISKDDHHIVTLFQDLRSQAVDAEFFEKSVFHFLHHTLLQAMGVESGQPLVSERIAHYLLSELSKISHTAQEVIPLLALELKMLEIVFKAQEKGGKSAANGGASGGSSGVTDQSSKSPKTTSPTSAKKAESPASSPQMSDPLVAASDLMATSDSVLTPMTDSTATAEYLSGYMNIESTAPFLDQVATLQSDNLVLPNPGDSQMLLEKWQEFLDGVKHQNSSVAAILGSAKPQVGTDGKAVITVYYRFHKEQLQQPKFMRMLHESVQNVIGHQVDFEFVLAQPPDTVQGQGSHDLATLAAEVLV